MPDNVALMPAYSKNGKPIAFVSNPLTDDKSQYANIDRGLFSVVYLCEHFHTSIYSHFFMIETDHKPLEIVALKNITATLPHV